MALVSLFQSSEIKRIVRYYLAGVINTLFGYGLYAGLVALGWNAYVAQVIAHILGMAFNYFTFSRYAFADHKAAWGHYLASYGVNYALSFISLIVFKQFITSDYAAGLASIAFVSVVNYLLLRRFVFRAASK